MFKALNPVLYAVIVIPVATVLAGFATLYFAIQSNGHEMPAEYAWEGAALDADLARANVARELQISVLLSITPEGRIDATLAGVDSADRPPVLRLTLTHATQPKWDETRELRLQQSESGRYSAEGQPLPAGAWWVEVADGTQWRVRRRVASLEQSLTLGASS